MRKPVKPIRMYKIPAKQVNFQEESGFWLIYRPHASPYNLERIKSIIQIQLADILIRIGTPIDVHATLRERGRPDLD